jgi:hypothetical protein
MSSQPAPKLPIGGKVNVISVTFFLSAVVLASVLWTKFRRANSAQSDTVQTNVSVTDSSEPRSEERRSDESSPLEKRATVEKPEQWRTIAKGASLQLLHPESLTLNRGVIALLDLTPSEGKELNMDLESLIDRLRAAERKHAYVLLGSDGSEQIVVESFDRRPLIRKFRETVAGHLSQNVADFCAEQMLNDRTLALGNGEVRLHLEADENGRDMMVVSRGNPAGDPTREGDAAPPLATRMPAQKDFGIRYRHLGTAAKTLPRKTGTGK